MKKVFCILFCVVLALSLSACAKIEITPAPEIAAIRNDMASYPEGSHDYDNKISARELRVTRKKKLTEYKWAIRDIRSAQGYTSNQGISWGSGGINQYLGGDYICLRYNYGKYYAVVRVNDGSYLFILLDSGWQDSCFIKQLSDIKKADTIQIGEPKWLVKLKLANFTRTFHPTEDEEIYVSRCSDLTTRTYIFAEGKLKEIRSALPENSVLTYLLPQDLALIS